MIFIKGEGEPSLAFSISNPCIAREGKRGRGKEKKEEEEEEEKKRRRKRRRKEKVWILILIVKWRLCVNRLMCKM